MRVLVTWGSKRGGTEGIARTIGEVLREAGFQVELLPADEALNARFDAVIVGGALYANRWHVDARRFVRRRERTLQRVPVWFFSSGPLDSSAEHQAIPPVRQVETLMGRVGAQGHATFGGRLAPDAKGFVAAAIAKKQSGDFRNATQVQEWARGIAAALPSAQPHPVITVRARSFDRLALHAFVGWLFCTLALLTLPGLASVFVAPLVFALVSWRYFAPVGARDPLPTAAAFVVVMALLDALVVGVVRHGLTFFASPMTWLPLVLVFLVTWAIGALRGVAPAHRLAHPARKML